MHVFKYKCRNCGLHGEIFSWHENWRPAPVAPCLECGANLTETAMWWHEERDQQIFEQVPGGMELEAKQRMAETTGNERYLEQPTVDMIGIQGFPPPPDKLTAPDGAARAAGLDGETS